MKAMEKIKLSKERVNLIADLKSGNLKGLAKIKASKRVVEIVVLLGGGAGEPTAVQKTFPSTKSIVNSTDDLAQRIATLKEKRDFLLSEMKRVGQRYDGSTKIVSTALANAKAKGWMSESTLNAIQNTRLVKSNSTANSALVAEVEGALIFLANDSDAKRDLRLSQQQERDETLARQADEDRLAAEKATAEKQENDRKAAAYFDLYGFDEDQIISLSYKGVLAQIRKAKASGNADSVKSADQAYRRVQQNIVEMTDLLQEIADGTKSKADFFDWSGSQYFPNVADILNGIDTSNSQSEPATNPLYQSVLNGAGTPAALAEPKHGDKVQVTGVVESSKDSPNLKFIRDDSGKSVTIFSQFGKSLKNGMTIKAELKWTGSSTGWAYSKLLEIISDPLAGTRVEPVRKKKELSVADAGNLLYEMDGNRTDTVTLQEGWGKSTTYTRDEVLAVLATVQPTSNPLYQSVLDGAEVTIELVKQVRAEGQKDPDHPQLRPAVRVIVEAVKAMAA